MEGLKIIENEDGSADLEVELTDEEGHLLLKYVVTDILKKVLGTRGRRYEKKNLEIGRKEKVSRTL